jgi:transglutaminase-like putative cysteine protease
MNKKKKIARGIMQKVYDSILPYKPCSLENPTPKEQLEGGYGYCATYVNVFKWLLSGYGIECRTITAISIDSKTGRKTTHVLAHVRIDDKWILYDPTLNLCFGVSFEEVLENPNIANGIVKAHYKDERWKRSVRLDEHRGFYDYSTKYFYKNIVIWIINRDKNLGGGVRIE